MEKEVYKKDMVVPDDPSSWFVCRRMDSGELLLTLKDEMKERGDFQDMLLETPVFDHGFTAFRVMKRHGGLEWITFINETRREQSQTFSNGCYVTRRDEWETGNIKIILGIVDEIIKCGEPGKGTVLNPVPDKMKTASSCTGNYVPGRIIKRAGRKIHDAGGCDARDEYGRGYDDAIVLALDILLEETGYVIEDILDYEEDGQAETDERVRSGVLQTC